MSRFFFALWPDPDTRNAMVQCRSQLRFKGRPTKPENLHITLLFIGKMTVNQVEKVIQQAGQIHCPAFELVLDSSGYFKRSQVFWLGAGQTPEPLITLHRQLIKMAYTCQLPIKEHRSFAPHVTLSRKTAPVSGQTIEPVAWSIDRFVLLESIDTRDGVQYNEIKSFTCNNDTN